MGKLFVLWFLLAAIGWSGATGAEHWRLVQDPHRVAVVMDSSYPMTAAWEQAMDAVDALDSARYTEYAALTEKGLVHSWSGELNFARVTPYAPRDTQRLSKLAQLPELANAERIVYVTTEAAPEIPAGWDVLTLR